MMYESKQLTDSMRVVRKNTIAIAEDIPEAQCDYRPAPIVAPAFRASWGVEIDDVGHWVQHEASAEVSDQLVKFLRTVNPA
jgi:pimeloyl-ACP methyl ester carboxylesterase